MSQRGFASLAIIVIILGLLAIGGTLYYKTHGPGSLSSSSPIQGDVGSSSRQVDIALSDRTMAQTSTSRFSNSTTSTASLAIDSRILAEANAFLIARVGQAVFERDIWFDATSSVYNAHSYDMAYDFRVPGAASDEAPIAISIDAKTQRVTMGLQGVPDCVAHPTKCEIHVNKQRAIEIAAQAGFYESTSSWSAFLDYDPARDSFMWNINESVPRLGCFSEVYVTIDAVSGIIDATSTGRGCLSR